MTTIPTASLIIIAVFLTIIVCWVSRDIKAWWRWKHRDPDDPQYWHYDQWADYYRNNPDKTPKDGMPMKLLGLRR